MAKWADYLVAAASYDSNREIVEAEVHEDLDGKMGPAEIVDKLTISHNMQKGKTYMTIFKTLNSWRRGERVHMFSVGGSPYLRIDKNKVSLDNLGDVPEIDYSKKKDPPLTYTAPTGDRPDPPKPAEKPKPEARARPEPEPAEEIPASPRGSLPAAGEVGVPFEDLQPDPVAEDSVTQLEPAEEIPASPRGSLPAAGEVGVPFEDLQPDPVAEDSVAQQEQEPSGVEERPKRRADQEFLDYEQGYLRRLEEQKKREEELADQARAEQEKQEEAQRQVRLEREEVQRQKRKAEARPAETAGSIRGSLPAAGEIGIPFEDLQPEQAKPEPAAEPEEGVLNFVDPAKEPEHYVRRFLNEPGYKEWFNQNYPDHTIYRAVGISEEEFKRIVAGTTPRPEPPEVAGGKIGQPEGQEMDFDDDDEDKDPTPEQLQRFEELEKQLEEAIQQSEQVEAGSEDEATDEDLAKLEDLEKKVAELESLKAQAEAEPDEPAESPHGALPADGEVAVPFEETQPEQAEPEPAARPETEPIPEGQSIAEQYEQISILSDKIRELESALASAPKTEPALEPEPETVEGMIERFDEASDEQLEQLEKLEEQIGQIEDADIESTLLAKLRRQVDRLDAIEQRIASSQEPTQEQIDRATALERQIAELEEKQKRAEAASDVIAYCVRCKAKRSMSDPEETTMKNGRPATRGTCSACGTKMFRIGSGKSKPRDDAPTQEQLDRVAELERQIADLENKRS